MKHLYQLNIGLCPSRTFLNLESFLAWKADNQHIDQLVWSFQEIKTRRIILQSDKAKEVYALLAPLFND